MKKPDDKIGEKWKNSALSAIAKANPAATAIAEDVILATGWTPDSKLQIIIRVMFNRAGTWDYAAAIPVTTMLPEGERVSASKD